MGREFVGRRLTRGDFLRMSGGALAGATALGSLAGCGGGGEGGGGGQGGDGASGGGPAELTLWAWLPDFKNQVDMFRKANPDIKVKLVNAGQGEPQYQKLRTALKAGSGAPDVVQVEFQYIPTFRQIEGLADLGQYGANDVKADYAEWTWSQVSDGESVYGLPWDSGPTALLYRQDIFDKYGLEVPTTWDQFAEQAEKLNKADSKVFMVDFTPEDGGWITSLMWQAGSRPFEVNGEEISINLNDEGAKQFAEYWGDLIERKLVATKPGFTNEWYRAFAKGTYATWPTAAWGPVFLEGVAGESKGKWRAAPLPQWEEGAQESSNWGGSTLAVTTQSKSPEQAAQLAQFLTHDPKAAKSYTTDQFLFPVLNSLLESPEFTGLKSDFYGGQAVNAVFAEASDKVDTGFQWSPFQDYVFTQMTEQFGAAVNGKIEFAQVPDKLQDIVTRYAAEQGFTVA